MVLFTRPVSIHISSQDVVKPNKDQLFKELFERDYRRVVSVFERRGFSREDARDLAQTTFIRIYERWKDDREDLPPWFYVLTTARNVGHNWIEYLLAVKRNAKTTTSLDDMDPLPHLAEVGLTTGGHPASALDMAEAKEEIQWVSKAITEFSRVDQRCLKMKAMGHTDSEIADALQLTVDAVKGRLKRARTKLKKMRADAGFNQSGRERQVTT